jgi:hypothetical protein
MTSVCITVVKSERNRNVWRISDDSLKVLKISHGNNTVVAQAFLELIDEAFRQHRQWREHHDAIAYHFGQATLKPDYRNY